MHIFCWGCTLMLILSTQLRIGDAASCGPAGRCVCANSIMDCRQQSLPEFPQSVGNDIKAVYLDDNRLTDLKQIPEESNLQTLVLKHNQIATLEYDAFDNLDNLKTLYLSNNQIKVIADDIFEWNPLKLEVLHLDGNRLEFIQHFLFYDLEQLTDLNLQNNRIVFIHPHAFLQLKNLRSLKLDGNKLHTFNHRWIDKLQANMFTDLRFDNNPWSCDCAMNHSFAWLENKHNKSKWFHDITQSHLLTCATPPELLGKNFKELYTNKTLVMEHCDMPKITGISKPSVLRRAQTVKLRCVLKPGTYPIPTISWTAPNRDVYRLNTAINYDGIDVEADGSLTITDLSKIDNGSYTCNASNSRGSHIATTILIVNETLPESSHKAVISTESPSHTRSAFTTKHCPASCQCVSRHIDCSGDGSDANTVARKDVPKGIPTDAVTISLAGNEIKSLGAKDFATFHDLEELRLDDNVIKEIDTNAFAALARLTTLTLQHNALEGIEDKTFSNLDKLTVLVLDRNLLTQLRKRMFKGLESLKWLYVRHNDIETLDADAFHYLVKIKFIHLESNKLLSLPSPDSFPPFKQLTHLTKIFVDDNNFQCGREMESVRKQIRSQEFKADHADFYGDGIICSAPSDYFEKNLADIKKELTWEGEDVNLQKSPPVDSSSYSGLLFGGIAVGIILTFVILILWRKYGRTLRTKGRSYNYSDLRGNDDSERNGLTDNVGGQEAFV